MSEITKKSDQQKDAEAEVESFRKDLGPFVFAAKTTRMAMLFADAAKPDNPIIFANDSLLSLAGYDREEVLGKSFSFLMANGSEAEALTRIKAEFEGSSGGGLEVLCRRKHGGGFWAAVFVSPVRNARDDIAEGRSSGPPPQAVSIIEMIGSPPSQKLATTAVKDICQGPTFDCSTDLAKALAEDSS